MSNAIAQSIMDQIREELHGHLAFKFNPGQSLDDFCLRNFANYTKDRFEPLALRVFHKRKTTITLYAIDKGKQKTGEPLDRNKLPVKKFKTTEVSLPRLLAFVSELNFTLNTGTAPVSSMQVINK